MEQLGFSEYGLAGLVIGALFWYIVKKDVFIQNILDRHTEMHKSFTDAINLNTEVTRETNLFMKNLNGKLEKAFIEKATGK